MGQMVCTIPAASIPDQYKTNDVSKLSLYLTGVAVASTGNIYAVDGYGRDFIHRFHKSGRYLGTFGGGGYERKLATLARVPLLLIIDDFGLKPLRPPADEDLHDLIAERYEQAATILTSNLDFPEWDQAFPANRLLASATLDRLRHNAYCLVLDGDSFRAPRLSPSAARASKAVANNSKNTQA